MARLVTVADDSEKVGTRDDGFELRGRFYPWRISDHAKDLQLIDRLTGMGVDRFFELLDDDEQATRPAIMLAMVACSIRAGNPDWSVERVLRTVNGIESLSEDVVMLGGDEDESEAVAPPPTDTTSEFERRRNSNSPVDESSSPSTPKDESDSSTSYAIPS